MVFLFKQKTAYEMRISDWSSDVCSSELLARGYEREESPAARDAMAQILTNSRMCAEGKRPLCQDTGIVNVFLKVGMDVRFDTKLTLQELCDEGVRRGYTNADNPLRASVLDR